MSTVKVEVQLSSEELLKAVEQLSQADLERFVSQVIALQAQRKASSLPQVKSVMITDFRLVHPDGRSYLLEIVVYWCPEYLQKKFSQVRRAGCDNLILAISERLNLEKSGVKLNDVPAIIIWFKDKLLPKAVLEVLD
ncbi:DUF790 family protein [Calothrix sp. PCC 7507]|uniref:DUF790 family protein n=1 Tax=Calothrix sp. PCC 7507 TaxID=99598 RepID=UPI0002D25A75|nr:DUF790 family protein [Calothrix sp. PCC 7507]